MYQDFDPHSLKKRIMTQHELIGTSVLPGIQFEGILEPRGMGL